MKRYTLFTFALLVVLFWLVGCDNRPSATETPGPTATPQPTVTPEPSPTPAYEPVFETAGCQFQFPRDREIRCGYLVVPENRDKPDRMIRLHVAVIPSISKSPAPDPIVYLSGGPGAQSLQGASGFAQLFREVLKERDLILFDQRGVGYSEPSLNCPEFEETLLAHIEVRLNELEQHALGAEAMAACRERLIAEGIDLSAYNSAASAADLDDLRRALGYATWNLFGVSYGTKLALTTMREYEAAGTIRSVILDSVYPLQVSGYADLGVNADHAFKVIFERCATIENCNNDYPDLETRFYELVDALNNEPMTVVVTDRINRTTLRVPFDGDDLIQTFFQMAYESDRIIYLPKMIRQLEGGVSSILTDFLTDVLYKPLDFSEGMFNSVQCYEEAPFISTVEVENAVENLPPQLGRVFEIEGLSRLELCEMWHGVTADPVENEPVVSDIPTLILEGDYDPITPPSYGLETAEYLSHHFYFEFKGQSHGVAFSHDCGMTLIAAFLDQPDTKPDAGCMDSLFIGFVPF